MKLKHWILFVVVQSAGFFLPSLANVHSNITPVIMGVILLLPGSVIAFIFPGLSWALYIVIVGINAAIWCLVAKFGGKELHT